MGGDVDAEGDFFEVMDIISESLTEELRRCMNVVKNGYGTISDGTFRALANESYRIYMEANEATLPDDVFNMMLPILKTDFVTRTAWKITMLSRRVLPKIEAMENDTAAALLMLMMPLINLSTELVNDPVVSTMGLVYEPDCITLKSQVSKSKLGASDSSLKKCMTFSMTTLPLFIQATKDGKDMAEYMSTFFDGNLEGSLLEGRYTFDLIDLPSNMEGLGPQKAAKTVFPLLYELPRFVKAAPDGQPELGLRVKSEDDYKGTPPATLEWKSFDEAGIEELLQASTGALQDSYFRQAGQSWQFYEDPPYGIGTLYSGPSAIAVFCYEMVGRLMFSLYDSGYSLGTQKHKEIYDLIEQDISNGGRATALDLSEHVRRFVICEAVGAKVRYTTESVDGQFYKILRHDRFRKAGPKPWRDLYNVYKKLAEIQAFPESLLPAKLYYGEYQVAVGMPFCTGATPCALQLSQPQKEGLLEAIVALGEVGLCYTDFRPPNLLRTPEGKIKLVDYDDMALYQNEVQVKEAYRLMGPIMFDGTTQWADVAAVVRQYAEG